MSDLDKIATYKYNYIINGRVSDIWNPSPNGGDMALFKGKKKEKDNEYYSLAPLLATGARYMLCFSERSNGKTFAVLEHCLQEYWEKGHEFGLIRRWDEDFKGGRGPQIFQGLSGAGRVAEITGGEWTGIYYYARKFYLCRNDGETIVKAPEPFGYCFALSTQEHDKSTSYPNIKNVFFDEFISKNAYIADEFVDFCNVLSTIIRRRDDVKIFMMGNTVNPYCPYFKEMGLKHIRKQEQGTIEVYEYGDTGLSVACEYAGSVVKKSKPSDIYFAFDNPKLSMITGGAWELAMYPHLPRKYRPEEVRFSFFIDFDEDIIQCDFIKNGPERFIFCHKKSTPIKSPDKDLIYSMKPDPRRNWCKNLLYPTSRIQQIVLESYKADLFFYQDNFVGETIRNYINECAKKPS